MPTTSSGPDGASPSAVNTVEDSTIHDSSTASPATGSGMKPSMVMLGFEANVSFPPAATTLDRCISDEDTKEMSRSPLPAHSPLPHLPDEIWVKIIKEVFNTGKSYNLRANPRIIAEQREEIPFKLYQPAPKSISTQILRVNKWFLAEGRKALYGQHLIFDKDVDSIGPFLTWIGDAAAERITSMGCGTRRIPDIASFDKWHLPNLKYFCVYGLFPRNPNISEIVKYLENETLEFLSVSLYDEDHFDDDDFDYIDDYDFDDADFPISATAGAIKIASHVASMSGFVGTLMKIHGMPSVVFDMTKSTSTNGSEATK